MLLLPAFGGFHSVVRDGTSARPVVGTYGTAFTPGASNAKGSYTQLFAALANDAYGLFLNFNSITTKVNSACDIGIDPAGGTSYTVVIPDLLTHGAPAYGGLFGGYWYYFPIFIKAGSTIGVRGMVDSATAGTGRCSAWAFCQPRDPYNLRCGSIVEAVGFVAATSEGTVVTPGTAAEGAWASLGTSARRNFWWQCAMGTSDSTMAAVMYHSDIGFGDGTNNEPIITDSVWQSDASEQMSNCPILTGGYCDVGAGKTIYGRSQCSGTADSDITMVAYGLA